MKKILLLLLFACLVFTTNAQLRISTDGNVGVGTYNPQYKFDLSLGLDNQTRISTWTDAYIDNTGDCGAICLYPQMGYYLQFGKNSNKIGQIWCHTLLYLSNIVNISDARYKENIMPIDNPLERIKQIRGIQYTLKESLFEEIPEERKAQMMEPDYGFIAQELQEVFPELVVSDSSGYLSVKYIRLIPVLVEAIKEQQVIIENLQEEISKYDDIQIEQRSSGTFAKPYQQFNELRVFQNAPNPFNESTIIRCYIPESEHNVKLCIYDIHGVQQKCIAVTGRNFVDVQIQAGELPAGIYAYLLKSESNVSESKQMIVTN